MTGTTSGNTFNFKHKKQKRNSSIYEFNDSKIKHIISLNKTDSFLGSKSGVTHDITWGVLNNNEIKFENYSSEYAQKYTNTIFSILDDYISKIPSGETSQYVRANFYPNDPRAVTKKNIAKSGFQKKYGIDNVSEVKNVLFIKMR